MCWRHTKWCCVLLCLLTGCQTRTANPRTEVVQRSQPLLGTFVTITACGPDRAVLQAAISAAFGEVRRADALMSVHRPDSELARVNAAAFAHPVTVSAELLDVLQLAQAIAEQTDGAFDATVRPLTELWGFIWKEHRLPTDGELSRTLPLVNYRNVQIDPAQKSVRFLKSGMSMDPGGIGKGVAVDRAIEKLRQLGVTNAMVKAGGDLRVIGTPPGDSHWRVQLEDPQKRGHRPTIRLSDAALSTSGNYENYFEVNGRRFSHLLDPRTGLPIEGVAACTVIAPTCAESDAWATAFFVLGPDRSLREFGSRRPMRFVITTGEELAVKQSPNFPQPLR